MMACMMFNEKKSIKPFYAEAESYPGFEGKQMSYGIKKFNGNSHIQNTYA